EGPGRGRERAVVVDRDQGRELAQVHDGDSIAQSDGSYQPLQVDRCQKIVHTFTNSKRGSPNPARWETQPRPPQPVGFLGREAPLPQRRLSRFGLRSGAMASSGDGRSAAFFDL